MDRKTRRLVEASHNPAAIVAIRLFICTLSNGHCTQSLPTSGVDILCRRYTESIYVCAILRFLLQGVRKETEIAGQGAATSTSTSMPTPMSTTTVAKSADAFTTARWCCNATQTAGQCANTVNLRSVRSIRGAAAADMCHADARAIEFMQQYGKSEPYPRHANVQFA